MSRVAVPCKEKDLELIVGIDPPLQQWFFQLWDYSNGDEPEEPKMDSDPFNGCTRSELIDVINKFGDDSQETKSIRDKIAMDLDPASK